MFRIYLQRGDSVVVQSGHLLLRQGVSCLVVDLEACVELQHVQQLQEWTTVQTRVSLQNSSVNHTII